MWAENNNLVQTMKSQNCRKTSPRFLFQTLENEEKLKIVSFENQFIKLDGSEATCQKMKRIADMQFFRRFE